MNIKSAFKGWLGETAIKIAKKIVLDGKVYKDLNNVTIETENGTTQIDHIILSPYGIFVIETKNMTGWIYGDETQRQWTQVIKGRKFRFQNPLHQNYRHVKALEWFLGLPPECFFSIVCFSPEGCQFKTPRPKNVIVGGPFWFIKDKTQRLLTDEQVDEAIDALQTVRLPTTVLGLSTAQTHKQHLESLKERYESTSTCPKCAGTLVPRESKKGKQAGKLFYGCTNFPTCRYMREAQ